MLFEGLCSAECLNVSSIIFVLISDLKMESLPTHDIFELTLYFCFLCSVFGRAAPSCRTATFWLHTHRMLSLPYLDGVVRSIRYPLSQYLAKTFGICIFYLLKSSALFSSNSDVFISMGNFWKPLQ
jgi:hypothetical protein